jgi:acyl-coenzyme A thioesterase PaaI-like protein
MAGCSAMPPTTPSPSPLGRSSARVLTAGYTINLLAPVVGERLVTRAVVVSAGQRLITARCELIEPHPEHDRVCAIAQGTIARTG